MSARAFRFFLQNDSGSSLTKTFDHLCHGDWTPSLRPPDSIPAGQLATWRSESSGVGTGTEAYVKYSIDGVGDTVYVYWDNPFAFGVTHAKGLVSTADVEPDCDFEKSPGGSGFQPLPSKFDIFLTLEGGGPGGEGAIGLIAEIPFAPILVLGTTGITADATASLALAQKTTSLKSFATRRRVDPSKGVRSLILAAGQTSLRATMGL